MAYININTDYTKQKRPYFIYRRLEVVRLKNELSFRLEPGSTFLLRYISYQCQGYVERIQQNPYVFSPCIEFYSTARGRYNQNIPLPINLLSTPGASQIVNAPLPVDLDGYGKSYESTPLKNRIKIDDFFYFNENFILLISFNEIPPTNYNYIDILVQGYYIPSEKNKEYFG